MIQNITNWKKDISNQNFFVKTASKKTIKHNIAYKRENVYTACVKIIFQKIAVIRKYVQNAIIQDTNCKTANQNSQITTPALFVREITYKILLLLFATPQRKESKKNIYFRRINSSTHQKSYAQSVEILAIQYAIDHSILLTKKLFRLIHLLRLNLTHLRVPQLQQVASFWGFLSAQMAFPSLISKRRISVLMLLRKIKVNFITRSLLQHSNQRPSCHHLSFRQFKIEANQASLTSTISKRIFYQSDLAILQLIRLFVHGFGFIIRFFFRSISFFLALASTLILTVFYLIFVCSYWVISLSTDTNISQSVQGFDLISKVYPKFIISFQNNLMHFLQSFRLFLVIIVLFQAVH